MAQKLNRKQTGNWEELGRTTLGSNGDTISVQNIPARKYLRVEATLYHNGSQISSNFRFNNDGGSNYAQNRTSSGDAVSQAYVFTGNSVYHQFSILEITNVLNQIKQVFMRTNFSDSNAAAAPIPDNTTAKWVNTTQQINRIDAINTSAGDYLAGSEVVVWGHD